MNTNQKKFEATADPYNRRDQMVKFLSAFIGGGSLVYFFFFLIFGTVLSIPIEMNSKSVLLLDFGLSLMFFSQHSIMVRPKFKAILRKMIPEGLIPAFYSITSGITLVCAVMFWQKTGQPFFHLPTWMFPIMAGGFALGMIGFYWGVKSLPFFDPLGLRTETRNDKKPSLKLIGPYRLVRHPLYFFVLILIWTSTSFTLDRILFNCLWSLWIIMGSWLEEKELVTVFGQDYQTYQQQVPMLFPIKKGY